MNAVRSVRAALAALALTGAVVVAGPVVPSSAHAELISSTPVDGATLPSAPASARLTFTDKIAPEFVRAAVTTPAGTGTVQASTTGQTVTVPVPAQGPGAYRVTYRVVSADGHPISGELRFTVAGTPTATVTAASPPSSATTAGTPAADPSGTGAAVPASPATPTSTAVAADPAGATDGGQNWLLPAALVVAVAAAGGAVLAATRGRRR